MFRSIVFLSIFFCLLACSPDKEIPTAPAGKLLASQDAPVVPENLRAEALTDTTARVSWDAVEGAADYDINYKPARGGKWTNWPHKGTRLYSTIYGLEPDTEYRWAVRAENRAGASDWVFGENFTTLVSTSGILSEVIIEDSSDEAELFRAASVEIDSALKHLLPIPLGDTYGWVDGILGSASSVPSGISFKDYSLSGRFILNGRVSSGILKEHPPRGEIWVREVGSDHRGFFIGTRHTVEKDRRKRLVHLKSGEFVEFGKEFLDATKGDILETLKLALETSRNAPNTFIDGFMHDWAHLEDSFVHVEVNNGTANWRFDWYTPLTTKEPVFNGELTDIRINQDPVRIKGMLRINRVMNADPDPINSIGLSGYGVSIECFVEIDVSFSGGKAEGTLGLERRLWDTSWWDTPYNWTLEELSEEHTPLSYTWE